jgi:hypothetical protein
MQTAEPRHGDNFGVCLRAFGCRTPRRSLFAYMMGSVVTVVAAVLIHQPLQMAFIEDDLMVE